MTSFQLVAIVFSFLLVFALFHFVRSLRLVWFLLDPSERVFDLCVMILSFLYLVVSLLVAFGILRF